MDQRLILLDMDGVLCDFAGGVAALFGQPGPRCADDAHKPLHEYLGIPKGQMWGRIGKVGSRLWEELQPLPWAEALVALCRDHGDILIATSPSLNPGSLAGKLTWMQRRFGRNFRDFAITPQKHLMAAANRFLIDDTAKHVEAFRQGGGQALLFPSWENGGLLNCSDPLALVRQALQEER
ncbi:MAG: hypothetical protein EA401_03810 [Planctomycetota bacterium]|nr:MAG: hypothetical protein EA401_03810 [Planctomycetota bacterium]